MSWARSTSIRRSYWARLVSIDLSLKRHDPNAPAGVWRKAAIAAARFFRGIDQVFAQRADDAVACRVHLDALLARGFDDRAGAGIDDGGHAARLRVKQIAFAHESSGARRGVV